MGNTTRRSDQSQLDWLWEMYGERPVTSDPNEAKGEDILSKDGTTRMICRMIQNLVRKLDLVPNPHCNNLLDVVVVEDDGDRKVAFSIEKEDHLVAVKMRKSTQADVDDQLCNEVNKFVGEFRMMSGKRHVLDFSFLELEGVRTNSIETFVEDGKVYSNLRLAQSLDKCISAEITRAGLIIELNVADSPGQAQLVPTRNGLTVENKWEDGTDYRFSMCTYAQYMALCNGEGGCSCHDDFEHECECGCCKPIAAQKGHIYFITDKNFFYLNGVRYGYTAIVSTDTVNHTVTDDGIHQFNVNVSGRANNLLQAIESGLYCDIRWSGSNKNNSFRVYNERESDYDRLTEQQKKEAIFYCYDTHRIFINGVDFSSVDLIGKPGDTGTSSVYGYMTAKLNNLDEKINTMQKQVNADMTLMSERIGMLREKTEQTEEDLKAFKEFEANNNQGLANSIGAVDERVTLVAEMAEKTDKEAVKWTDNNGVTRDILLENNSDTLSGKSANGDRVKIVKIDKNSRVSLGDPSFPISLKGSEVHPVYNEDHELAFLHELNDEIERAKIKEDEIYGHPGDNVDSMTVFGNNAAIKEFGTKIEDETKRAQAKEDEILGHPGDASDVMSVFGVKAYVDEKANESVKLDDVEDAENPGRKAITLKNHDLLLGTATNGGTYNLAMVSKWDVADYGSKELPINLNGSKERPTYNDDDELALVKDLENYVEFVSVETPELPGRKAMVLKNHDLLLGTATDGTTYNLAMISKWDVADFGTNKLPINLNGSKARPTYNDLKELALMDDLNDILERISLLEKATSFKVIDVLTGQHYDNAKAAIEAGATNIRVYNDFTENISIAPNKSISIDFGGNKLTGYIKAEKLAEGETSNIVIKNAVIDNTSTIGVLGQDQETIKQGAANVRLENCTIMNFTDKGLYMTNAGKVEIIGCTFDGCAKGKDHMVDFNLCSVQNADILIKDCKFINIENTLAPIKVCVRGGNDDYSHDVKTGLHIWNGSSYEDQEGQPATIANLVIENCTFEQNESAKADIIIGDVPNYDSPVEPTVGPRTSTGNFPYSINCGGNAKVWKRFEGEESFENL